MKIRIQTWACLAFSAACTSAWGQTVQFTVVSIQPNNLGGVYTDPYNAKVNGVPIPAFCDDFVDNVTPPQTWTALATDLSQVTGSTPTVYFSGNSINGTAYSQTTEYIAAAILATQSLSIYQTNAALANVLSFALWGIFDPTLLYSYQSTVCAGNSSAEGCLNSTDLSNAKADLNLALTKALTYSSGLDYEQKTGSNVQIYSAAGLTNASLPRTDAGRPQEFLTVQMAEAPSIGLLGLDLAGFGILAYFFRRRSMVR